MRTQVHERSAVLDVRGFVADCLELLAGPLPAPRTKHEVRMLNHQYEGTAQADLLDLLRRLGKTKEGTWEHEVLTGQARDLSRAMGLAVFKEEVSGVPADDPHPRRELELIWEGLQGAKARRLRRVLDYLDRLAALQPRQAWLDDFECKSLLMSAEGLLDREKDSSEWLRLRAPAFAVFVENVDRWQRAGSAHETLPGRLLVGQVDHHKRLFKGQDIGLERLVHEFEELPSVSPEPELDSDPQGEPRSQAQRVVLNALKEAEGGYVSAMQLRDALGRVGESRDPAKVIRSLRNTYGYSIQTAPRDSADQGYRLL